MSVKLHTTKDGSSTLYSEQFEQFYHNPNGAASESRHVFFETPGLLEFLNKADQLTILEVGFGTGLNFLLLLDYLMEKKVDIPVTYYSIEAFPVNRNTAMKFEFRDHLKNPEINDLLPEIFNELKGGMNTFKPLKEMAAELKLFVGKFEEFEQRDLQADFIFHDAFSPEVNEELWTADTFQKLADYSKPTSILATYCAASKARGAMCASGWYVARTQGALGKREMTLAARSESSLLDFKRVNEKRLAERYRTGDFS